MTDLSLTGKRWVIGEDYRGREQTLPASLALLRGMPDGCAPLPCTHPDEVSPHLPQAVERIRRAVEKRETVGIFGDYDCDGITAAVQLFRAFRRRDVTPHVYLPHREREGYGLKEESIRFFAGHGVTLLLTVDTGISSVHELALARELSIDVIVVDHHHLPPELPPAFALIHPGLAPLPGVMPAAAGVALSVVAALEKDGGKDEWEGKDEDMALAAIGTVADLVELRGGNRTLVTQGIAALGRMETGPLRDLLTQAGIAGAPTSRDIAYRIAPRLNAAGRMADPRIALRALLGDRESLALLESLNRDRQMQTQEILRELQRTSPAESAFLIAASPDYPAGILGLIAGKLTETHGRPSMVAQIREDMCVASLRSIPGFHVTEALQSVSDLLTSFGGHAQAAGCTFPLAALPELTARLQERASSALTPAQLLPQLRIDGIVDARNVSLELCHALGSLEPFGQGNPEPRFLLPAVGFSTLKRVGKDFMHLQGTLGLPQGGNLKAVGFGLSPLFEKIPATCDVACRIGVDSWNGSRRPQIFIEDVREAVLAAQLVFRSG
ncbi:MAG: DHH family phosphoesterase [Candidatus Peribacteraceae bacterium]